MTTTFTRTHVHITFANPYLTCDKCRQWVTAWHEPERCGCEGPSWNEPCGHIALATSACPSWGPVDGCCCVERLGRATHGEPPTPDARDA